MSENKNILIVGSSGFIGSFLVDEALQRGYKTIAGMRKSSKRDHIDTKLAQVVELTHGNKAQLKKELQNLFGVQHKPDYIIYNAGTTKVINANDFFKVNYDNLKKFVECLVELQAIPQKFLYISSLSAMGIGDETGNTPLSISDIPNPYSEYGKSKLKAERHIESLHSFPYIILRPTGVYGPREKDYALMMKMIEAGWNIKVGMRKQLLTFIHVKDLSNAVFLSLESDIANKTYLVSDGKSYTDEEYTQMLKELLDKKRTLNLRIPYWVLKIVSIGAGAIAKMTGKPSTLNGDKYKIMKQRNWTCDIEPIRTDLGFVAEYDLRKGLEDTIKWYRKMREV